MRTVWLQTCHKCRVLWPWILVLSFGLTGCRPVHPGSSSGEIYVQATQGDLLCVAAGCHGSSIPPNYVDDFAGRPLDPANWDRLCAKDLTYCAEHAQMFLAVVKTQDNPRGTMPPKTPNPQEQKRLETIAEHLRKKKLPHISTCTSEDSVQLAQGVFQELTRKCGYCHAHVAGLPGSTYSGRGTSNFSSLYGGSRNYSWQIAENVIQKFKEAYADGTMPPPASNMASVRDGRQVTKFNLCLDRWNKDLKRAPLPIGKFCLEQTAPPDIKASYPCQNALWCGRECRKDNKDVDQECCKKYLQQEWHDFQKHAL